ncbi:MAG: hypothetical protein KC652_28445, partial [Cyanobacteria bacterium HKST-UBA01]|nr:hypothetical protein [Cyanobacteria bacterium HKST-UBA01]
MSNLSILRKSIPTSFVLLTFVALLFLEYVIASSNINGSQERVLPWFICITTSLAVVGSILFSISNYRN